jgi:hypothetical protein
MKFNNTFIYLLIWETNNVFVWKSWFFQNFRVESVVTAVYFDSYRHRISIYAYVNEQQI